MATQEKGPALSTGPPETASRPTSPTSVVEGDSSTDANDIARQMRRRREAAARCEPLECGHRDLLDCDTEHNGEPMTSADPQLPDSVSGDFAQLWADAKSMYLAHDYPKYGSDAWRALHPDDPRRLASALHAAEMWRRYGDEDDLVEWLRAASRARPSIADRRTRAELDEAAKPKPPRQLRATAGWPPIAVPGRPGKYLTYRVQKAA